MSKFICDHVKIKERKPVMESNMTGNGFVDTEIGETIKLEITLVSSGYTKDITPEQIGFDVLEKLKSVAYEPTEAQ